MRDSITNAFDRHCKAGRAGCWVLALALTMGVSPLAGEPAVSSSRYLLVVDTSRSMRNRSRAMLQTVQDLLNSGMQGQLSGGETLGVWTFNEDLYTGRFPLQVWAPQEQKAIARRILGFLKAQACEKQPSLDKVMPAIQDVVKESELITVILISAGDAKIHGTPFDDPINDYYARWHNEQQAGRVPLVTILRARNGKMLRCSVRPAAGPMEFPPLPPPEAGVVRTEPPAAARPAPAPPPQSVPPQMAPPLILSGRKLHPETTQPPNTEAPVVRTEPPAAVPPAPAPPPQSVPPQTTPPLILSGKKLQPETAQPPNTEAPVVRTELPAGVPPAPAPPPQSVPPQTTPPLILSGKKLQPETAQPQKAEAPVVRTEPPAGVPPAPVPPPQSVPPQTNPPLILSGKKLQPETAEPPKAEAPIVKADSSLARSEPSATAPTPPGRAAPIAQPAFILSHARPISLWAGGILAGGCCLAFGLFRLRRAREVSRLSLITRSLDSGTNKPPGSAPPEKERGR